MIFYSEGKYLSEQMMFLSGIELFFLILTKE